MIALKQSFHRRWHAEEVAVRPDGKRLRVRVGRTGVHRYSPLAGGPNLIAVLVTWLRFAYRSPKTWTVQVTRVGFFRYAALREEEFLTRSEAAERAEQLVGEILGGAIDSGPE